MTLHQDHHDRSVPLGAKRGARGLCPNCGEGKLFRKYLKVQPCPVCSHDNAKYPADDGPAYFTILLVGHLVVAPLLLWPWIWEANPILVVGTTIPGLAILCLLVLPIIKGAWIGFLWGRR